MIYGRKKGMKDNIFQFAQYLSWGHLHPKYILHLSNWTIFLLSEHFNLLFISQKKWVMQKEFIFWPLKIE